MADDYLSQQFGGHRYTGGSPNFNEMQGGAPGAQGNVSPYTGGLPGGNGLVPIDASMATTNPGLYQFLMRVRDPMYQNTPENEARLGPAGWNAWNPWGGAGAISTQDWAAGMRPENMGMTGAVQPGQPGSWLNAVPSGGGSPQQQPANPATMFDPSGGGGGQRRQTGPQWGEPPPEAASNFGGNTPNFGGGFAWRPNQTPGYSQY